MSIQLKQVREAPTHRPSRTVIEYGGTHLARDVRSVVAETIGGWRAASSRDSDYERDALAGALAEYGWERIEHLRSLTGGERRALLMRRLRENLLMDSREWQDSLDGRVLVRTRARNADGKGKRADVLAGDVAAQAERFRAGERAREQAQARIGFLALEPTDDSDPTDDAQPTDWLEESAARERARQQGSADVVSVAEHSREAVALMLDGIADALAPIELDATAREAVLIALLRCAHGEPLPAIAREMGMSGITCKRRSAAGGKLLTLLDPDTLVSIRRGAVRASIAADSTTDSATAPATAGEPARHDGYRVVRLLLDVSTGPVSIADVDALLPNALAARTAIDARKRREAPDSAPILRERVSVTDTGRIIRERVRATGRATGSAADVLRYIAACERVLSMPAHTCDTTAAVPVPAPVRGIAAAPPNRVEWAAGSFPAPVTPLVPCQRDGITRAVSLPGCRACQHRGDHDSHPAAIPPTD